MGQVCSKINISRVLNRILGYKLIILRSVESKNHPQRWLLVLNNSNLNPLINHKPLKNERQHQTRAQSHLHKGLNPQKRAKSLLMKLPFSMQMLTLALTSKEEQLYMKEIPLKYWLPNSAKSTNLMMIPEKNLSNC